MPTMITIRTMLYCTLLHLAGVQLVQMLRDLAPRQVSAISVSSIHIPCLKHADGMLNDDDDDWEYQCEM